VFRRISVLATLVLALAAGPAYASHSATLHTQMASGSATSSRQSGGCAIATDHGALSVTCHGRAKATLTYTFTSRSSVSGRPVGWVYTWGHADVDTSAKAGGRTIHVTLTVSAGSVTIHSVCVSYYA
jgi:hypothetical protein